MEIAKNCTRKQKTRSKTCVVASAVRVLSGKCYPALFSGMTPAPLIRRAAQRVTVLCAAVCLLLTSPAHAQRVPDREPVPPPPPPPPAHAAVLAVVDSALAAINTGDGNALSDVMTDSGQVYAARERDGVPTYTMRTAASQRAAGRRPPIIERGFDAEVRIVGTMAWVWLPYDLYTNGKWSHCGVDQFTLVQVQSAWRIVNLTYSVEQPPACRMHPSGPPKENR